MENWVIISLAGISIPIIGTVLYYASEMWTNHLKHKREIEQMRIDEARRIEAREDRLLGLTDEEQRATLEIVAARLDAVETRLGGPSEPTPSKPIEAGPRTMTEIGTEQSQ